MPMAARPKYPDKEPGKLFISISNSIATGIFKDCGSLKVVRG
jgi:hypothetical protein